MADIDAANVAVAGGASIISSGGAAALVRWLAGRERDREKAEERNEREAVRTQLALVQQKLDHVASALEKHAALGERVALLEAAVKALHERVDGKRGRR